VTAGKENPKIVPSLRTPALASVAALAAGLTLGVTAPLLSAAGNPTVHALDLVLSAGWAWAALAFFVGLAQERKIVSALLALEALLVADIAYYVTKLCQGVYTMADFNPHQGTYIDWNEFLGKMLAWGIAACVFGSLLGFAGNLARKRGIRGLPFRLLIPAIAIYDTTQQIRYAAPLQGAVPATTWWAILLLAVAAAVILVGQTAIASWNYAKQQRR
jgi:hypothetical protein